MDAERMANRGLLGIRPYVGGKPKEEVQKKYHVSEPVKMNSNENPLGVSPAAVERASGILPMSNTYPESTNRELREQLAYKYGLDPENVIVGNGADEIIYYIAMSFINDGDEVIIPRITFPIYEIAFRMMRAEVVLSGMKGYTIDLDDILKHVTNCTKVIALCNPNNPTGHALGREAVHRFVEKVPEGLLILMDEAYMEFANPDEFPDTISLFREGRENLLIIRTLSKALGLAGFRVGYGMGHRGLVALMNRIKLPFNISIVSQHAALGALEDTMFLDKTLENTRKGRKMIERALEDMGVSYVKSSTNFILIETGRDAEAVTEELMKRGVIVRSARMYEMPTSIRVTIGTQEQNVRFIDAFREVMIA
jgi:histidinol-phosphate aminotransferase